MTNPQTAVGQRRQWSTAEKIFVGSLLFIIFLAYLVPVDVLQKYPQLIPFVDFMASWNMQIRRVGEISGPRSQVNMFIYSMAWCLTWIPFSIALGLLFVAYYKRGFLLANESFPRLLLCLAVSAYFVWHVCVWRGHNLAIDSKFDRLFFLSYATSPAMSVIMTFSSMLMIFGFFAFASAVLYKFFRRFKG